MPISKEIISKRHNDLAVALHLAGLDALALNPGPSLHYLTGLNFHLMERPVVALFIPHSPVILILPELETAKLSKLPFAFQAFPYGENPEAWKNTFRTAAKASQLEQAKIGVEPGRLRLLEFGFLQAAAPSWQFPSAETVLSGLRMVKQNDEIEAMRKAVHIAQDALQAFLPSVKIGVTEKELASELTLQLFRQGSDPEMPFSPIIASGPNSANPHAYPTDRKLRKGDLLIVDWGASCQGYFSDLTRTFAIGAASLEDQQIAAAVLQANLAAQAAVQPGVAAGQVDRTARAVIEKAGFGSYFIHRTGHGLGLEGHEHPYLFGENQLLLKEGMTFTIEPGIYLPDQAGVRIEDDCIVTDTGCESLSDYPRELAIIE